MKEFLLDKTSNIYFVVKNQTSSLTESSTRQLRTTAPRSTSLRGWSSATTLLSTLLLTCYVRCINRGDVKRKSDFPLQFQERFTAVRY